MSAGSILFWCAMALYFACQILVVEGIYRKKLPLPVWPYGMIAVFVAPFTLLIVIICGGYTIFVEDEND